MTSQNITTAVAEESAAHATSDAWEAIRAPHGLVNAAFIVGLHNIARTLGVSRVVLSFSTLEVDEPDDDVEISIDGIDRSDAAAMDQDPHAKLRDWIYANRDLVKCTLSDRWMIADHVAADRMEDVFAPDVFTIDTTAGTILDPQAITADEIAVRCAIITDYLVTPGD